MSVRNLTAGLLLCVCVFPSFAAPAASRSGAGKPPAEKALNLVLVFPGGKEFKTEYAQFRFAGHTDPKAAVRLNDKPVRVYPTGAFVGLLPLKAGANTFEFEARLGSEKATERLTIERKPPRPAIPKGKEQFGPPSECRPSKDMELRAGDHVHVRCVAGAERTVVYGIGSKKSYYPARETAPGFYEGEFEILPEDDFEAAPIAFFFKDSPSSKRVSATTVAAPGKLTVLRDRVAGVLEVTADSAWLYPDPWGNQRMARAPKGTRLHGAGRVGNDIRVDLPGAGPAWINKGNVTLLPSGAVASRVTLGSAEIRPQDNDGARMAISCDAPAPFAAWHGDGSRRLTARFYGVTSGAYWLRSKGTTLLDSVTRTAPKEGAVDFTLQLNRPVWGYRIASGEGGMAVEVRPFPPRVEAGPRSLGGIRICLDPGHGGPRELGALGSTGLEEKTINLRLAKLLGRRLEEEGAQVLYTRTEDAGVSLEDRLQTAEDGGAEMIISLHCNSIAADVDPLGARGPSVHYYHALSGSLARHVHDRLRDSFKEENVPDCGLVANSLYVVRETTWFPSILVEFCFMSHPEDEALLLSSAETARMVEAVCQGVMETVEEGCAASAGKRD